ncbi:MAG TPA: hypothetical protein VLE89_07930 [Chlamydiales bacterium]|nr:hypothetical protein [Chlamydiales bacterium]
MWARVIEFMLAVWLSLSRFIFNQPFSINELICASFIALFSLLSFHSKFDKMHLCNYLIVIWLFYLDYSHGAPLPPFMQNYQVLALLILMTALIPSHSHQPPRPWRKFLKERNR